MTLAFAMPQPPEPFSSPRPRPARLMGWVTLALIGTAAASSGLLVLVDRPEWWKGLLAASVASVLACALSLVPLLWGLRRDAYKMLAAYFVAAGVRAIVSVGGCLLAILAEQYPPAPTLLLMVPYYFAVLAVESAYIGRLLWTARV